jgi:CHASE3 domain sensor protein
MDSRKLREALRKEGIFIHERDPILEMAAICNLTMADTLKAIEGVVKAAADRTSAAAAQTVDASRKAGDALINQGASFLVEQFREIARETTAAMVAELRQEAAKAKRASHTATVIVWALGSLGVIALAGFAGFLLAGIGHG